MKQYFLPGALAIGLALGLGTWSADRLSKTFEGFADLKSGSWKANTRTGSGGTDPYLNTYLARSGTLPLGSAEGLQFTAESDISGQLLNSSCDYAIDGRLPATRLWTLRVASAGDEPVKTAGIHSREALYGPDSAVHVTVSRNVAPLNWVQMSIERETPFKLVVTLYDSAIAGGTRLGDFNMPTISKGSCIDE